MNFRVKTLENLSKIILEDEFDDEWQNEDAYEGDLSGDVFVEFFKRNKRGNQILDIGCGCGDVFEKLPEITHAIEPNDERRRRASEKTKTVCVRYGWSENIEFIDKFFNTVLMWGTFTFVRSPMETLYEVNRVLIPRGVFIFDVVVQSTLPIAQTVSPGCFINWAGLFGFHPLERRFFGPQHHLRMALALEKIHDFDHRRFLMPQVKGSMNNYLETRDWYLK